MASPAVKAALESAFSGLVGRLIAQGYTDAQAIAAAQAQIAAAIANNTELDAGVSLTKITSVAGVKRMVDAAVAALVGNSPEALNTINELAAALNNDPQIISGLYTAIGEKETPAGAQAKVDLLASTVAATYATKAELATVEGDLYAHLTTVFNNGAQ